MPALVFQTIILVDTSIRNRRNLHFSVAAPSPCRYRITPVHTVAPDYALARVLLNCKAVKYFVAYGPEDAQRKLELGEFRLGCNCFELPFTVFGKCAKPTGSCVILNQIELRAMH